MNEAIVALYRAVERTEDHAATVQKLLATLRAGHRNARGNAALRTHLENEIAYYVAQLGQLHAERDQLRQAILKTRGG